MQQFCAHCGARVQTADQRFCVRCGAKLDADDYPASPQPDARDRMPADYDLSGFGQMNHPEEDYTPLSSYAPADGEVDPRTGYSRESWQPSGATQPIGAEQNAWRMDETAMYPQEAPQAGGGASRIVIIVAAVIIALVAVGFIAMNAAPGCSTGNSVPPASTSSTADDSSSMSDVADSEAENETDEADGEDADEAEIYRALADAYDEMGVQADRVKDTAATLNSTIFASDRSKRQAAADDASDLKEDISRLLDELGGLEIPSDSRYYGNQQTLIELQEDLYNRIDVMCQAWGISLQYDKPKDHESVIRNPLNKDNDSKGVNVYKKDFETRYPDARPQK